MTLNDFSKLVTHKDQEGEMYRYFDEHCALYSLLARTFSDIIIDLEEDATGCYYVLRPIKEADISYMVSFYNNTKVSFFSHKFTVESTMHSDNIYIRFIDKKDMH